MSDASEDIAVTTNERPSDDIRSWGGRRHPRVNQAALELSGLSLPPYTHDRTDLWVVGGYWRGEGQIYPPTFLTGVSPLLAQADSAIVGATNCEKFKGTDWLPTCAWHVYVGRVLQGFFCCQIRLFLRWTCGACEWQANNQHRHDRCYLFPPPLSPPRYPPFSLLTLDGCVGGRRRAVSPTLPTPPYPSPRLIDACHNRD